MTALDLAALVLFGIFWLAYQPLLKGIGSRGGAINTDMTVLRRRWMVNMASREVRLMDSQLLGHAINSASFFASSNLIVIAAIGGALFSGEQAFRSIEKLGVVASAPDWLFSAKLCLVIVVLARGFLDFIWALRQMNYTLAAIGAAPAPSADAARLEAYGDAVAEILNPALSAFNTGVRGYYFALAAAAWLSGAQGFVIVTLGAVALLFFRQRGSAAAAGIRRLRAMIEQTPPNPPQEGGGGNGAG